MSCLRQLTLSELGKGQGNQAQRAPQLLRDSRLLFPNLEIARVIRVQRQINPEQRAIGENPYRLLHLSERRRHVSQKGRAQREIVVRENICRVPCNQIGVLLHALLIVACHPVVHTSGGITLALGHAVKVAECFLEVLLRILQVAEIQRQGGQRLVADAELWIQLHRPGIAASRLIEPACGRGFPSRRIVTEHFQRRG